MTLRVFTDDIEAFLVVSRHLSFSRAAEELFLTPQAVSARIQRLERRLGFPLFHRTTRSVERTPEAEILLAGLGSAMGHLDEAVATIVGSRQRAAPAPEAGRAIPDRTAGAVVRRVEPVVVIEHGSDDEHRMSA